MSARERMTGEEMGRLSVALCAAFSLDSFDRMLLTRLGRPREHIVADGPMKAVTLDTIRRAVESGWERRLIRAACDERPDNPELQEYCRNHPHLVDAPPPAPPPPPLPPEEVLVAVVPDERSRPRRGGLIVAAVTLLLVAVGLVWVVVVNCRPGENPTDPSSPGDKAGTPPPSSEAPGGQRLTGPLRLDETRNRELVVTTFRQFDVKEFDADPRILTGLWIIGPPTHEDLEVIRELARSLRPSGAIVVAAAAAAEDEWLEAMIKVSGFPLLTSTDGRMILNDKFIDTVVFVGLLRSAEDDKRTKERGRAGPVVDACRAGKDCYVVLSTADKGDWPGFVGRAVPAEERLALNEARKAKRMLYASIPGKDAFTHDFSSFFKAVRARDASLPGSVENLLR